MLLVRRLIAFLSCQQANFAWVLTSASTFLLALAPAALADTVLTSSQSLQTPEVRQQSTLAATVGFLGYSFDDKNDASQAAGLHLGFLGDYRLDETLTGSVDAGLVASSGNSRVVYNNDFQPKQSFYLSEVALNYKPAESILLRVGALDQGKLENPILFSRGLSFPGLSQSLTAVRDRSKSLELQAEEAIPSSTTTNPVPTQEEGVPSFIALGAISQLGDLDPHARGAQLTLSAHYFSFNNLPTSVAQGSRFRGNDVYGLGDQGALFSYSFRGAESSASLKLSTLGKFKPFLHAAGVLNVDAPSGSNQGYLAGAGTEILVSSRVTLTPEFEYFTIQADAAPALYNDPRFGHTNFQGISIGTQLEIPRSQLIASARWVSATMITTNPYQNNFNLITVQLGKTYALY